MARFIVPDGWTAQAYRFALDPNCAQQRALAQYAGAARFAFNHMLAQAKAVMDQRGAERTYGIAEQELTPVQKWSLPALRRTWNTRKDTAAPWWADNSKEAYNTGLDNLARALDAWAKSRNGIRKGPKIGFPRFKSKSRCRPAVRFTTGCIRLDADSHHVTLPRLGTIKTHEPTRKVARRVAAGTARILSATVSRDRAGRWHCSLSVIVQHKTRPAHASRSPHPVVGVDVGVRDLLVVATPEGTEVDRVPVPRSLAQAQTRLRRWQRRAARQHGPYDSKTKTKRVPSRRWRTTQARIGKIHVRAANIRRDTMHNATTGLAEHHRVVVVETLNAAGMRARGGSRKRGLNRALADAALAEVRRMLGYKTRWYGSTLVEADRWYPSSKTCSACGGQKPNLTLADRTYTCEYCGAVIDRDLNAATNLARLGAPATGEQSLAGSGPATGRGADQKTQAATAATAGGDEASTPHQHPLDQTGTVPPQGEAA